MRRRSSMLLVAVLVACDAAALETPGRDAGPVVPPIDAANVEDGSTMDEDGSAPAAVVPSNVPGTWVTVPARTFLMGSSDEEPCREGAIGIDPSPEGRHEVTLTHAFFIADEEVTREQFAGRMGYDPSVAGADCASCPVENLTWHEAASYCNALSAINGDTPCYSCSGSGEGTRCETAAAAADQGIYDCPGFRLPTDAEWEHAYRAETTTAAYNGPIANCTGVDPNADPIAWHRANSGGHTHPGGSKLANPWNLYDMAGNVWEWAHEPYQIDLGRDPVTDPFPVHALAAGIIRGGDFDSEPADLRAAGRLNALAEIRHASIHIGVRCAKTVASR